MKRLLLLLFVLTQACASAPVSGRTAAALIVAVAPSEDWAVEGSDHVLQLQRLEGWCARQGITVEVQPMEKYLGATDVKDRNIYLSATLSPNDQLYTLLHEVAHVYQPRELNEREQEAWAELIASAVIARLGLPLWPQTSAYLHAKGYNPTLLARAYDKQINRVSKRLWKAAR